MRVVVDTSAIVAVIANEPEKASLIELTRGMDLIAPHSVHWEIGNAFSSMLKRKRIPFEKALEALGVYAKISIEYVDVEIDQSLKISDELGVYAYDAYIIRCAHKYRSPLVSLDRILIEKATGMGIHVMEV